MYWFYAFYYKKGRSIRIRIETFKLQKFSNSKFNKELLDEVILDYEEIQNEFEVGNETIEEIERQKVEDNIITTEIKVFVPFSINQNHQESVSSG